METTEIMENEAVVDAVSDVAETAVKNVDNKFVAGIGTAVGIGVAVYGIYIVGKKVIIPGIKWAKNKVDEAKQVKEDQKRYVNAETTENGEEEGTK